MAIVNGQNVNKIALGGEIFVKKIIGSRITIPAQTSIYAKNDLNDTSSALGTTTVIARDCTATVIGLYYPQDGINSIQVDGVPGDLSRGWVRASNVKLGGKAPSYQCFANTRRVVLAWQ